MTPPWPNEQLSGNHMIGFTLEPKGISGQLQLWGSCDLPPFGLGRLVGSRFLLFVEFFGSLPPLGVGCLVGSRFHAGHLWFHVTMWLLACCLDSKLI